MWGEPGNEGGLGRCLCSSGERVCSSTKFRVVPSRSRETAVRRIVATLLVVASPAVLAVPVGARPAGLPGWAGSPATPAVAPAARAPAVLLAPVAVTIAPVAPRLAPAVTTPAVRRAAVRSAVARVRYR